jgi:hypothetical protein
LYKLNTKRYTCSKLTIWLILTHCHSKKSKNIYIINSIAAYDIPKIYRT